MTYTGSNGKTYITEAQPLGNGGEGEVYRIQGNPDLVLKLFLPNNRTEERHRKLLAMIQTPLNSDALRQTTWPVDVVYDNGSFTGYVMPFLSGVKNLNDIYSDNDVYSLSEMIMIAKNLCAAVHSIHQAGQVIGDFNPNNICVDPNTGLVTLIDTDSYHITDNNGGRTYRCAVGLPEYLAKELQDKLRNNPHLDLRTLPEPTFKTETDLFALAVHVFALLMNGCHPFASAVDPIVIAKRTSVVNPQPIENIRNSFFPFYVKKPGYTTPKYAPEFAALPPVIQQLFVKAFVDGSTDPNMRPSAQEWYEALSEFEKHLKKCSKNSRHEYYDQLNACPWCELEKKANMIILPPDQLNPPDPSPSAPARRSSWPLWLLCVLVGVISVPLLEPILTHLMQSIDIFWVGTKKESYILLAIGATISSVIVAFLGSIPYQTAVTAWPWLCLSLLTSAGALLVASAIVLLVVGAIYLATILFIIGGVALAIVCMELFTSKR